MNQTRFFLFVRPVIVGCILLLITGCAAVTTLPQQPFEDYQTAISDLKTQADQALKEAADTELSQYKAKVNDSPGKVTTLMLTFPPGQPYGWCYTGATADTSADAVSSTIDAASATSAPAIADPCGSQDQPVFAKMAQMQQTLANMNTQLLSYAGLLVALSGADSTTQFDAESEAQKFDGAATSLLGQLSGLGVDTSSISSQDLALFSTLASNLVANYLENKRRDLLAEILAQGQEPLRQFVGVAQTALQSTAAAVITQYQNQALPAARAVATSSSGSAASALDSFLTLNDKVQAQLTLLQTLSDGYAALPNAQGQLITALNESRNANLAELITYADTIKQQYETLKATNGD